MTLPNITPGDRDRPDAADSPAARAIADPLKSVRDGLERIARGELDVHVHVEQDGHGCYALDQELLDASAAGLLVGDNYGHLRLMAATSDALEVVELFQIQNDEGPCRDCFRSGEPVSLAGLAGELGCDPAELGEAIDLLEGRGRLRRPRRPAPPARGPRDRAGPRGVRARRAAPRPPGAV